MDPAVARSVAHYSHTYARDGSGELVIEHVARVAAAVPGPARVIAWLHDVPVVDGGTVVELRAQGLTDLELEALEILRRGPDESFEAYALRVAHAPGPAGDLARSVKLAELDDEIASGQSRRARWDDAPYHWARRHIAAFTGNRGA